MLEPPAPLLPPSLGTLQEQGAPAQGRGVPPDAGEAGPILQEDGVTEWAQASYGSAPGVHLRAYRFADATGAFAAYTYLRKPGSTALPPEVAARAAASGSDVVLQSGVSVVVAELPLPRAARDAALRQVLQRLPKVGGREGLPALLPTYVPVHDLLPGSERYSLGPIGYAAMHGALPANLIGFDKAAETLTAEYPGRNGTGVLTMVLYPTPQLAGEHGRGFEQFFNSEAGTQASMSTVEAGPGGPMTQLATGSHRVGAATVKLRREGPLVLLATGGFTAGEATALIDGVHLRTEATFDKPIPPEFHVEVRKTASLLVSIAVFSGVAGLAAVLLGLFLGFGRALIRVLMGKPAATEPEFLQLDLSGGGRRTGTRGEL